MASSVRPNGEDITSSSTQPDGDAEADRDEREDRRVVEVDPDRGEVEARNAAHAVGAVERLVAKAPGIKHLRGRQGHHDEERAGGAHREQADDEGGEPAGNDRGGEGEVRIAAAEHGHAGEHVAADAEQAGVAEGDQPGAGDEVEAERQDGEDRGLGDQLLGEVAGEALAGERGGDEGDADRAAHEGPARHGQPGAVKRRAGSRPLGRKISTSAMTR